MASSLIGVAANLTKVIIHLTYTYKLQNTHIGILVDRIISLEKPLENLERNSENSSRISEAALTKLISTLEEVQKLIDEHQKYDSKSKAKRFLFGDSKMEELRLIRERLDSSLLDLQLAITVEEAGNSERRVSMTARATVDILLSSVQQRATEAILLCVQCGSEYRQSENPMGSCKYHTAFPLYQNWKYRVTCCGHEFQEATDGIQGESEGCVRGVHCNFHHTQYPYSAYFLWMRSQVNENVKETWLHVSDYDFEDGIDKYASFGVSKDNLLFVSLGKYSFPLFLQYFDPNNMPHLSSPSFGNMLTIAMRGSDMQPGELEKSTETMKWVVDALWILNSDNEITGIRLSANSLSSKFPVIKELSFSLNPLMKGDTRVLSFSITPAKVQYTGPMPECTKNYTPFPDSVFLGPPLEPTYETEIKGKMQVRLKKSDKCKANPDFSGHAHDTFVLEFLVLNLSQGAAIGSSSEERMVVLNLLKEGKVTVEDSLRLLSTLDSSPHTHGPLTFVDARARFYLDGRWLEPMSVKPLVKKDDKLLPGIPFEVGPRGAQKFVMECAVKCEEKKKSSGWFNRAYICRLSPIIIEVTLEEMSGETCSIQTQFGNAAYSFTSPPPNNIFWLHTDDSDTWARNYVAVNPSTKEGEAAATGIVDLHINGNMRVTVTFNELLNWGYNAAKSESQVFRIDSLSSGDITTYGLVDLEARAVCGFKFRVQAGSSHNEGIWMIPEDMFLEGRRAFVGEEVDKTLWQPVVRSPENGSRPNQPPSTTMKAAPHRVTRDPPAVPSPTVSPRVPPSPSPRTSTTTTPLPATTTTTTTATATTTPTTTTPAARPTPPPRKTPPPGSLTATATTTTTTTAQAPPPATTTTTTTPAQAITTLLTPAPITPPTKAPETAPSLGDKQANKCSACGFGNKKDDCAKCKNKIFSPPAPAPALLCSGCRISLKGRCITCNNVVIVNKNVPAVICGKCGFSGKDKCVKCGKLAV